MFMHLSTEQILPDLSRDASSAFATYLLVKINYALMVIISTKLLPCQYLPYLMKGLKISVAKVLLLQ